MQQHIKKKKKILKTVCYIRGNMKLEILKAMCINSSKIKYFNRPLEDHAIPSIKVI